MSGFFESHLWEIRAAQCVTNNIIFDGFLRLWDDSQLVNDHICIIFWLRKLLNSRWRDFFLVRTKQTRILQLCRTTFVCQSISAAPRFFIIRPFCHTNAASIIWIFCTWPCSKCLTLITSVAQGFIPCASASPFQSLLQPRAWRILMPRVNRSTWSNTSTCALAGKNLIEISVWNPTNECLSSSERLRSGLSLSPSCSGSLP